MSAFLEALLRFDDRMEEREPGYKARQAQERAERERQWAEYRITVIAKYGSEDSVRVGTQAVETLDGWRGCSSVREAPDSVRRAVEAAWPMPSTILEAKAENDRWEERDDELAAVWGAPRGECSFLSLACDLRRDIVQHQLGTGLRAQCVADVLERHRYSLGLGFRADEIDQAVLADLEHLATMQ